MKLSKFFEIKQAVVSLILCVQSALCTGFFHNITQSILQLTSVLTSSTDLKAVDIEASFDWNKVTESFRNQNN